MALTKVSRGLLSTGIVDNSNATAITLNADESATFADNVGIGTGVAPGTNGKGLAIFDDLFPRLTFRNNTTGDSTAATVGTAAYLVGDNFYLNNQEPGMLSFGTAGSERMRLTAGGSLHAKGTQSAYISSSEYHQFSANIPSIAMYVLNANTANGAAGIIINVGNEKSDANGYFLRGYSGSAARDNFYVYTNGNVVNRNNDYNGLSDQKLKQDIADANNQWEDFKSIQFRKYRWKADVASDANAPFYLGVVAQELEAAGLNGLVSESPDKEFYQQTVTDDDGNDVLDEDGNAVTEQKERLTGETTKSVKMSILYAKGMVALQEAMERIETLEANLQALENN